MRIGKLVLFSVMVFSATISEATTYYSIANGAWTNPGIWSLTQDGTSCNCVPQGSDFINIAHTVSLDRRLTNGNTSLGGVSGRLNILASGNLNGGIDYNLDVLSQGDLTVCGRLTVKNLEFFNGSTFYFCTGSNITVNGDFINRNNSPNIVVDGTVTITGSFENGVGAIITGSGGFIIYNGPAVNNGSLFGCIGQYPCGSYPCIISSMCGTSTVLPVEWLSFEVTSNSRGRLLEWSTASEENSDFFQVQVSSDGVVFETIGHIAAAGNSSNVNRYEFLDEEFRNGPLYYRIRQIDFDGRSTLSETQFFSGTNSELTMIVPNPVIGNSFNLQTGSIRGGKWQVMLFDGVGRKILDYSGFDPVFDGKGLSVKLPDSVDSGFYSLVAVIEGESHSHRIMIAP